MDDLKFAYQIASHIQKAAKKEDLICIEEPEVPSIQILPESIAKNCKDYIKKVVREINGSYEKGFFLACAVMIRRLIETCMIEAFEHKGYASFIKNPNGEYKTADNIRNEFLKDPFNNLSRNARRALNDKNILELGHKCAHDRFFIARKQDIDSVKNRIRDLIEYLIHQFI